MKKVKTKNDYERDIEKIKECIKIIDGVIELHKEMKPWKIFKEKTIRYEKELNSLNGSKEFWEVRLEELEYEKKKLYP